MRPVWCIAVFIVQIVICQYACDIQRYKDWRNIRRERRCLTSNGRRGICVPPATCGRSGSDGSPNDLFRFCCKRVNGNPMVCCSISGRWRHETLMHSVGHDSLSIAAVSSRDTSSPGSLTSFRPLLLNLFSSTPDPELKLSTASIRHIRYYNLKRPLPSVLPSTASSLSASYSSLFSNSLRPLSNAVSYSTSTEYASISAASTIRDTSISNSMQSLNSLSFTTDPGIESASSGASVSGINSYDSEVSSSNVISYTTNPQSDSVSSLSVIKGKSISNSVNPSSNVLSYTDNLESKVSSSVTFVNHTNSSNSLRPLSNVLSSAHGTTISSPLQSPLNIQSSTAYPMVSSQVPVKSASSFASEGPITKMLSSTNSSEPVSTTVAPSLRPRRSRLVRSILYASTDVPSTQSYLQSLPNELSSTTSFEVTPIGVIYSSNSNVSFEDSDNLSSPLSSSETTELSTSATISTTSKVSTVSSSPISSDFASAFPEPPVCGVSLGSFNRVVGGSDASIGVFPWLGVIAYRSSGGFVFKCGASLITSQHSLTAAHCIVGFEDRLYFVRLGEWDFTDHNQTRPIDVLVKTMIKHESYSTKDGTNDIGLLVFYRRVIFTDFIRPICLPLSEELRSTDFVNYNPFIAGWGRTSYEGHAATRLQMLQIPVVSQEFCKEVYAPFKIFVIDERVICAGGARGADACNGDSGGPLMQPIWDPTNFTTYFYQTGIVSMGMKCGTAGFPAVYTRVTEFIPWIQRHVLGTDPS